MSVYGIIQRRMITGLNPGVPLMWNWNGDVFRLAAGDQILMLFSLFNKPMAKDPTITGL